MESPDDPLFYPDLGELAPPGTREPKPRDIILLLIIIGFTTFFGDSPDPDSIWDLIRRMKTIGANLIVAVGINDRLMGVYDVESIKQPGEFKVITIEGRIDLKFEETLYTLYPSIWEEFTALGSEEEQQSYRIARILRDDPYRGWGELFKVLLISGSIQATSLNDLRSVFKDYMLGISPYTYLQDKYDVVRSLDIYPLIYQYGDDLNTFGKIGQGTRGGRN